MKLWAWVTSGVGWKADVGRGGSQWEEDIQKKKKTKNRKGKKERTHIYTYASNRVCVYINKENKHKI